MVISTMERSTLRLRRRSAAIIGAGMKGQTHLHPSPLHRMKPTISEQAGTAAGTRQRCPGGAGQDRVVKRHEERAVIEHYIYSGRTSSNLVESLSAGRTGDDGTRGKDGR